jgi:hypothetical protein
LCDYLSPYRRQLVQGLEFCGVISNKYVANITPDFATTGLIKKFSIQNQKIKTMQLCRELAATLAGSLVSLLTSVDITKGRKSEQG